MQGAWAANSPDRSCCGALQRAATCEFHPNWVSAHHRTRARVVELGRRPSTEAPRKRLRVGGSVELESYTYVRAGAPVRTA